MVFCKTRRAQTAHQAAEDYKDGLWEGSMKLLENREDLIFLPNAPSIACW
jgi:hypothetical protein